MSGADKTVCLLGGTGFLGTAIRRRLAAEKHRRVIVVGRFPDADLLQCEQYIEACETDKMVRELASENVSILIDLTYSKLPATSSGNPSDKFSANIGATIRHLELARRLQVELFVFVSSGGAVYGDAGTSLISENMVPAPISTYGITKLACEHYVMMARRMHGLPTIIVRPSNVFGPGQRPFMGQGLVATAMGAALTGQILSIFGDGSQVRDYIFSEDFIDGLLAAVQLGREGSIYNIGSGKGTSVAELTQQVANLAAGDGLELRIDWQNSRPFDVPHNILNTSRLACDTGWRAKVPVSDGLLLTWDWLASR